MGPLTVIQIRCPSGETAIPFSPPGAERTEARHLHLADGEHPPVLGEAHHRAVSAVGDVQVGAPGQGGVAREGGADRLRHRRGDVHRDGQGGIGQAPRRAHLEDPAVVDQGQGHDLVAHRVGDVEDGVRHPVEGHPQARRHRPHLLDEAGLDLLDGADRAARSQSVDPLLGVQLGDGPVGRRDGEHRPPAVRRGAEEGVAHGGRLQVARDQLLRRAVGHAPGEEPRRRWRSGRSSAAARRGR